MLVRTIGFSLKAKIDNIVERLEHKLAEGKTKIIWEIPGTEEVLIENKDDITAGDGAKRDVINSKAVMSTQTTTNCFELLTSAGIPNHFLQRETDRIFRARQLKMIPIELVARRIAFGSYLKRYPHTQAGQEFSELKFELFAKDDANHDPLISYDWKDGVVRRWDPKQPFSGDSLIDEVQINQSPFGFTQDHITIMEIYTVDTFEVLEATWNDQGVTLVDLKIECGITSTGKLMVADVIDNDSWRIWPNGDPSQMADKQLYRDGQPLDYVADRYAWVAEATNRFLE